MKKFFDRLKDKGYKISGSKAFLLGVEFILAGIKKGLEMKTTIYCVIMN